MNTKKSPIILTKYLFVLYYNISTAKLADGLPIGAQILNGV